jgi:hypothetical protein
MVEKGSGVRLSLCQVEVDIKCTHISRVHRVILIARTEFVSESSLTSVQWHAWLQLDSSDRYVTHLILYPHFPLEQEDRKRLAFSRQVDPLYNKFLCYP